MKRLMKSVVTFRIKLKLPGRIAVATPLALPKGN